MSEPYNGRPPHVRGNDTSEMAADSVALSVKTWRWRVLVTVCAAGQNGMTCDEVEEHLGLVHQNASARIRELVLTGQIEDSGYRRPTRSGRAARVYWRVRNGE